MVQETKSPVIVIIGGGFSGSMVVVHLLKNVTSPLTVKLIECKPFVGRGNAYSTDLVEGGRNNTPVNNRQNLY
jgi:uncharacterized NAD(P)/FAD-binding protein YdhS